MTQPQWPHLENLDRVLGEYDPSFLTPGDGVTWVVTEKVHGFNARLGVTTDGTPWCGSRNQVVAEGDPASWPDALQGFVRWAAEHVDGLHPGETLFGEWAGKGVQKGIDYGEKDFWAFGSMFDNGETESLDDIGASLGLASRIHAKFVPVLAMVYEVPPSLEYLSGLRDGKSSIAEQNREGVVVTRYPVPLNYGRPVIAKFKAAGFSEVAHAPRPAKELPDMEQVNALVERYATPQRLEHVLDQVAEATGFIGNPLAPEYTGDVLRGMYNDIVREAGSEYEALSDDAKKAFGKALNPTTKRLLDAARLAGMVAA